MFIFTQLLQTYSHKTLCHIHFSFETLKKKSLFKIQILSTAQRVTTVAVKEAEGTERKRIKVMDILFVS